MGLGSRVLGLGFRVWDLRFRMRTRGAGSRRRRTMPCPRFSSVRRVIRMVLYPLASCWLVGGVPQIRGTFKGECRGYMGFRVEGFPKQGVPSRDVALIRIIDFGVYIGPPYFRKLPVGREGIDKSL